MKNLLIILAIMIQSVCISQNTDITLSEEQQIEVYKGLIQGEFLKEIISDRNVLIADLENQMKEDTNTIKNLVKKIDNLEKINSNNIQLKDYYEEEMQLRIKKEKSKRFNFGTMIGYGIESSNFKTAGFVGIGISYSLFRF